MKKTMLIASAAMIGVGLLAAPAKAQGVPQSIEIAKAEGGGRLSGVQGHR
jgi:hypothetical protein